MATNITPRWGETARPCHFVSYASGLHPARDDIPAELAAMPKSLYLWGMRNKWLVWLCLSMGLGYAVRAQQPLFALSARQLVVVRVPDSLAITGLLTTYEQTQPGNTWQQVLGPFPVTVGRKGLAWGYGIHPDSLNREPMKHEGDGKSPQGIFSLGGIFGYDPEDLLLFSPRMPYLQVTPEWICVDDTASNRYNRITNNRMAMYYVRSYERMLRIDDLYRLGITVNYNTRPVIKGAGSCIFLHLWRDANSPTAGCTAMSFPNMVMLGAWLDAARTPVLVQMTDANYLRYAPQMGLPYGEQ